MKKAFLSIIALLGLVLAAVYIFIPGTLKISLTTGIAANKDGLYRKLSNPANWSQWWPGNKMPDSTGTYEFDHTGFRPGAPRTLSLPIMIIDESQETTAELTFLALGADSSTLHLEAGLTGSFNPLTRIRNYFKAKKLKEKLSVILQSIDTTYRVISHLYDYDIQKKTVVDSNLVFTAAEIKKTPDPALIYSMVAKLNNFIRLQNATATGFPMLNVYTRDSIDYLVKVAIPVDRKLPDAGDIHYRWMLGGGNILITEVKGGPGEIKKAYIQILNYINDHQRIAPAIPFESLVTDRTLEKDSSKWITRIYYPVM